MHVVATAGHVDHGKSTLVTALTGQQPDRLAEERRRGLSIELGYCWTDLPGVGTVAFVDVPGHERFLTTTLAGLGPVPVAVLVVAADDPWMPQAAEHLAALDALGVGHGVVAVTRSDLADPAAAVRRARHEVARTTLAGAPVVAVSARTGAGLPELRAALVTVLGALPRPDPAAPVRLWVDRRFHVRGAGTVVTGTLPAGTLRVDDRLLVDGDPSQPVRVRGLECLGETVTGVTGVARTAVALGGRVPEGLGRGSVLVEPDAFEPTDHLDVRLEGDGTPPERPLLHVGATSLGVRVRPLAGDLARVTLAQRLPLSVGDRAVLRDPGSRQVWGLRVLDPAPPALGRRGAAAARATALRDADGTLAAELARRGVVRRSLLRRIGVAVDPVPPDALVVGDWLVSGAHASRLRTELARLVERTTDPAQPGVAATEAARALGLPDDAVVAALVLPPLRLEAGRVVAGRTDRLPEPLLAALALLEEDLAADPFAAPTGERLHALGLDRRALAVLARAGRLLRIGDTLVLLPGADDEAMTRLRALPQPFTSSLARQALGTSRRVALPLLEHLDRTGRTRRLPDDTRACR